ncbi:MAG TPA: FHA domain-containing protein [Clostridiaceae bacterium]|nr:FHA domain-containing protein [Clostridiaceae bacterium]
MYEIISTILKYVFTIVIYIFIYSIIRLIYLDIKSMNRRAGISDRKYPYLKLLNRRDELNFRVDESYVLNGRKTIGRLGKNDFVINDPFLSGNHAEFFSEDGIYYMRDLGSKNGSYINNVRIGIDAVPLDNGDKIQIGQLTFIFVQDKR